MEEIQDQGKIQEQGTTVLSDLVKVHKLYIFSSSAVHKDLIEGA